MNKSVQVKASCLVSAIALTILAVLPAAHAEPSRNIRPHWSDSDFDSGERENASWLDDTSTARASKLMSSGLTMDDMMTPEKRLELSQHYQDVNRDYELKRAYGLTDPTDARAHQTQMQDFSHDVVNQLRSYQLQQGRKRVQKTVQENPGLQPVVKPVAVIGVVVAVSSGTPVKLNLDQGVDVVARTDIRGRTGDLTMNSSVVNAGVALNMNNASVRDPNLPPPIDPTQSQDLYRVYMSRGLTLWDLSSQVSYGTSSATLAAQLSKPITQNLTAVVGSVRPMSASVMGNGEESLRLMYGMQF